MREREHPKNIYYYGAVFHLTDKEFLEEEIVLAY